jgi:hypothetical protein
VTEQEQGLLRLLLPHLTQPLGKLYTLLDQQPLVLILMSLQPAMSTAVGERCWQESPSTVYGILSHCRQGPPSQGKCCMPSPQEPCCAGFWGVSPTHQAVQSVPDQGSFHWPWEEGETPPLALQLLRRCRGAAAAGGPALFWRVGPLLCVGMLRRAVCVCVAKT